MHFLIDADVLLWKASTSATSLAQGRIFFDKLLQSYLKYLREYFPGMNDYMMYFTSDDKSNFRYSLEAPTAYKGNRIGKPRPTHFYEMKYDVLERYPHNAVLINGQEADDAIAIAATTLGSNACIVGFDKDFRQVADCWHWECKESFPPYYVQNPGFLMLMKKPKRVKSVFGTGIKWFYYQLLIGDTSDNIKGVPGVGPVNAFWYLEDSFDERDMWCLVRSAYIENGLSPDDAVQNGRLLWLKREQDEPLWNPPDITDILLFDIDIEERRKEVHQSVAVDFDEVNECSNEN